VTGAAGWLGRRLLDTLIRGLSDHPTTSTPDARGVIRALVLPGHDRAGLDALSDRTEVVEGELRRPEDCVRLLAGTSRAVIFHVAGVIHPRRVQDFYSINVDGTRNLMRAAMAAGARRVVIMSSNSPLGVNPRRDHVFDESAPYAPYMNYG